MINFALPGMWEQKDLLFNLLRLMKQNPDYFYDNTKIEAVYGNFHYCIFDGGRVFAKYTQATQEEIRDTISQYNKYGVKVRYIFTNSQLTYTDYYNRFCNVMLDEAQGNNNQIVLVDNDLRQYIEDHYEGYDFISSTTKCILNADLLHQELENSQFKEVCLDYNLNKNMRLLESLSNAEREKCEFLINAICPPNCPTRKEHYKLNSLQYLNFNKPQKVPTCDIAANTLHPIQTENKNNLSPEEIYNIYAPMGFQHFKIEGRTLTPIENACNYVKYLVRPRYQFYILSRLLHDYRKI